MSEKADNQPKPNNVAWVIFFIVGLLLSLAPMIRLVYGTVSTRSPTSDWQVIGTWIAPLYAYVSDDLYTWTGVAGQKWAYSDYGFSLTEDDTINKVEIGVEGFVLSRGAVGVYYSVNDGASWTYAFCPFSVLLPEDLYWEDVTERETWTYTLLDDDHLATMIYYQSVSGCYGLDAEVGLWAGGLKKVRDVQIGDVLTGWNGTEEIKEDFTQWNMTNFIPSTVHTVILHTGNWTVLRIIAESIYRPLDFKDVLVTPDHLLPMFKYENETDGGQDKIELEETKAEDIEEGDYFFGFMDGAFNWTSEETSPPYLEPYRVKNITEMIVDGVSDIQTDTKYFMGHYMLRVKMPWTGYVDWLPVRVTFTPAPPVSVIAPFFIGALVFFAFVGSIFYLGLKRKR